MVALGAAATVWTLRRGDPPAVPAAVAWFTLMEGLQVAGHATVGACGTPANEATALLSYLHIAFQPFVINAFAMTLVGGPVGPAMRVGVWLGCGASAVVMLLQLYPFAWAGTCPAGSVLCGSPLCVVGGDWHIAWNIPRNDLLAPLRQVHWALGGFPTYLAAAFLLPLAYGAWRFVLFHALAGPVLAAALTTNPNEMPAIWCLFSIGIVLVSLSPWIRARLEAPGRRGGIRPDATA
jgi:hypothetical protein